MTSYEDTHVDEVDENTTTRPTSVNEEQESSIGDQLQLVGTNARHSMTKLNLQISAAIK